MACEPVLGLQVALARNEARILVPARLPIGSTQDQLPWLVSAAVWGSAV